MKSVWGDDGYAEKCLLYKPDNLCSLRTQVKKNPDVVVQSLIFALERQNGRDSRISWKLSGQLAWSIWHRDLASIRLEARIDS